VVARLNADQRIERVLALVRCRKNFQQFQDFLPLAELFCDAHTPRRRAMATLLVPGNLAPARRTGYRKHVVGASGRLIVTDSLNSSRAGGFCGVLLAEAACAGQASCRLEPSGASEFQPTGHYGEITPLPSRMPPGTH
jgi:hypothetical protein